jgi:hypothetical protein
MRPLSFFVALTVLLGCGRVGIVDFQAPPDGSAGSSGATGGGGGARGAGGGPSTAHDAAATCASTALTTAPDPCAVGDWPHAQLTYKKTCKATSGGYQAKCPSYDAIAYTSAATETWCFYGTGTGQLVGSLVRGTKGPDACKTFDLHFTLPDTGACGPVSGGDCGPDAGR